MSRLLIPNTTQFPNALFDVIPRLSASATRVLLVIVRFTYGFGKSSDRISIKQLSKTTGLSHQGVVNGTRELTVLELVNVVPGRKGIGANEYSLNINLETGQLVKIVEMSKTLTSQKNAPQVVKIVDTPKPILSKSKEEIPLPPEAMELSQLLSDKIFENFPKRTAPTEAQLAEWAREADRINRIDGHSWAEIRSLLEWSQGDQFWRSNILSMQKFRKQWNQLLAQRDRAGRNPKIDALRRRTEEILKAGL